MSSEQIKCPKCGSTQITTQKKGFSIGQAIVGGVVGGFIGSSNIDITCLNCGKKFRPGDSRRAQERADAKAELKRKLAALPKEEREAQENDAVASFGIIVWILASFFIPFSSWKILIPIFSVVSIVFILNRMQKRRKANQESSVIKKANRSFAIFWIALIPTFLLVKLLQSLLSYS